MQRNSFRSRYAGHPRLSLTWGIPLAYTAATFIFGMVFPRLEHRYLPELASTMRTASGIEEKQDASVADRQGLGIGEDKTPG